MLPPKMNRLRMTQLERDLAHECGDSHISGRLRKRAVWTGRRVLREYDRTEGLSESRGRQRVGKVCMVEEVICVEPKFEIDALGYFEILPQAHISA